MMAMAQRRGASSLIGRLLFQQQPRACAAASSSSASSASSSSSSAAVSSGGGAFAMTARRSFALSSPSSSRSSVVAAAAAASSPEGGDDDDDRFVRIDATGEEDGGKPFADIPDVHPSVVAALDNLGFTAGTGIQSRAVPAVASGADVVIAAETGKGERGGQTLLQ